MINCSPQQRAKEKKTENCAIQNFRYVRKKLNLQLVHPFQIETRSELTKYIYLTIMAWLAYKMNILLKSSSVHYERQNS